MPKTIILHISDLHFSSREDIRREKEKIMNSLVASLTQLEKYWKPNVVCVSGDIVDKYDVSAYPLAKAWFENLAHALGIPIDNFVFTPGNHDCSRDTKKYPILNSNDDDIVNDVLDIEIPAYLSGRFEEYENFCRDLQVPPYTWNTEDNYLVGYRVINDVIYLGCNTEWFAYSDETKLRLGKKIVEELQQSSSKLGDLRKVAVMHHGSEVGFHENEIQYHNDICPALHFLWKICDLSLYGHSHEQVGGNPNKMENHCFTIKAGATSINSEFPNNVNVIRVEENCIELKHVSYNQQDVEQPWKVSAESSKYYWEKGQNEESLTLTTTCDIEHLRKQEKIYAKEILDSKLRQVKIGENLPVTILREVVIEKEHEEKKEYEKYEKVSYVHLKDVVLAENKVVVYGELGAGKSTILSQLVINLLDDVNNLPILIPAKELAEVNNGKVSLVLQQVCVFLQQQLLVNISSFDEVLKCVNHCYLFVDGLDEVDKTKQETLIRTLEKIPLMNTQISVILSTRSTETIEYHKSNWVQCSLGRLRQEEIIKILENEAKTELNNEEATICAKRYYNKISNNPMVQLVATTPLAVRLLYYVMRKNIEIDEYTIGDLLNILLEERVAHWDEKNISGITDVEFENNFPTVSAKKIYIGYLAHYAESDKITRKKLELMLCQDMKISNSVELLVEQTFSRLHRNGMATEIDGYLMFYYRPLAQLATGIFLADKIIKGELQVSQCSFDLWREISFVAGELRRADLIERYRPWLMAYIDGLKNEAAGLIKACYICYEAKDMQLAINMIENFKQRDVRPLWYYEPERNVSVSIVAQVIALAGEHGVDWFIESYLTLKYPVINAGSAFFTELYMVLAPLIKDTLTATHIEKLEKCIEPLEHICSVAYLRLPQVLCYLMPDKYAIERRLQLIAKISSYDLYKGWALREYAELSKVNEELCKKVLLNEKSSAAAYLWMKLFDDAPDINLVSSILEMRDAELIEECRKRLGDEKYIRYLRWLVANYSHTIAAASALQLCALGQSILPEIKLALVGGMINAHAHNCYEEKITELIMADGGLSKQWIDILFAVEHHVYGASQGSWRIFLRFLLESEENMAQDFIKNIKHMGPFLLARCEETRMLLKRLLMRPEYKTVLTDAMNSLNPEIRYAANRIALITCQELEVDCLFTVISECAGSETDNYEWQNYIAERKYQESSIKKLSENMSIMFPKMKALVDRIIEFNTRHERKETKQLTSKEMMVNQIEQVASHGLAHLRRYIQILNDEVNFTDYVQMREDNKNKQYADILYCFDYENQQYTVDWYRLLWIEFINNGSLFRDVDIFTLELIRYGKENSNVVSDILDAVKRICDDERLEKDRWSDRYHWLLLIIATFEGLDDSVIKTAFLHQQDYMSESSLALLSMYTGNLDELNIKQKTTKSIEVSEDTNCEKKLLDFSRESELISKQLDVIMQLFIQEKTALDSEYVTKLVELGENGALVAGTLCFCYGVPIPVESGLIARQSYFLRGKLESEVFKNLLRLVRTTFNVQLQDAMKLEEYKTYLTEKETCLEQVNTNQCFYISEYLSYMGEQVTEEKILKYLDILMNQMYSSEYTILVWEILATQIISNENIDETKLLPALEIALHRIIGACEGRRSSFYNDAYGQIALACMYWKICNKYVDLAQPVFERGMVQLIRSKYEKNIWDEERGHIDFGRLNMYLNMVPKRIIRQAIEGMKHGWLDEAVFLGNMVALLGGK